MRGSPLVTCDPNSLAEPLTAHVIFRGLEHLLSLRWIGGRAGAERVLWSPTQASAVFFGRLHWVRPPRLQVLGTEECRFLQELPEAMRTLLLERLLKMDSGALLVCGNWECVNALRQYADAHQTALWQTPLTPEIALERIGFYRRSLEASTLEHGEMLEVFGMGVLITGNSGIGKSELALELITRGHRLIADDTPNFTKVAPGVLEGSCPDTIRDLLEVRGLGILNIRRMFGDSAIKRNKRLRLVLHLAKQEEIEPTAEARLRGMRDYRVLLGVSVPVITLPIAPGRNLAVLVECAVRDHILRLNGYHAEEEVEERMNQAMEGT